MNRHFTFLTLIISFYINYFFVFFDKGDQRAVPSFGLAFLLTLLSYGFSYYKGETEEKPNPYTGMSGDEIDLIICQNRDIEYSRQQNLNEKENYFEIKHLKETRRWITKIEDITHKDVSGGSKSGMN